MAPRLRERYEEEIRPSLMERFGYDNVFEAPRLVKVSVNIGVESEEEDFEALERGMEELSRITGQWPSMRRARRSISAFGIRQGQPIGAVCTLRKRRMWEFVDRLINVAIPRIRDFRGLSRNSFDGRGNYSLGIDDHLIFPELSYDDVEKVRGMDITIVTTAETDEEAAALLELLNMPLQEPVEAPPAAESEETNIEEYA